MVQAELREVSEEVEREGQAVRVTPHEDELPAVEGARGHLVGVRVRVRVRVGVRAGVRVRVWVEGEGEGEGEDEG